MFFPCRTPTGFGFILKYTSTGDRGPEDCRRAVWTPQLTARPKLNRSKAKDDKPPGFSTDIVEECLRKYATADRETQGSEAFHVRRLTRERAASDAAFGEVDPSPFETTKTLSRWLVNYRRAGCARERAATTTTTTMTTTRALQAIQEPRHARCAPACSRKAARATRGCKLGRIAARALSRTERREVELKRRDPVRHLPCETSLPGEKRTGRVSKLESFRWRRFSPPRRSDLEKYDMYRRFYRESQGLLPCEESVKIEVLACRFKTGSAASRSKTEELRARRVGARRDPAERRHKQTLRPLDHVDSYLPIEKMFSDDTAGLANDNAEDRDRDYEEVVAHMQNQEGTDREKRRALAPPRRSPAGRGARSPCLSKRAPTERDGGLWLNLSDMDAGAR
ncbi:hypothetical protein Q5P01_000833 [Channa striata]|uniref:Uncharacterized protein n=1 Tax=Channa striata TaxID=64152 RepID=A0AA88IYN8_CHASR|nr:hypothetical protein Q5P01_000833 [Channa striata]